jgi:hypothetical protein
VGRERSEAAASLAHGSVTRPTEREILEGSVLGVSEQAVAAGEIVCEAISVGLETDHPLTVHAKTLR